MNNKFHNEEQKIQSFEYTKRNISLFDESQRQNLLHFNTVRQAQDLDQLPNQMENDFYADDSSPKIQLQYDKNNNYNGTSRFDKIKKQEDEEFYKKNRIQVHQEKVIDKNIQRIQNNDYQYNSQGVSQIQSVSDQNYNQKSAQSFNNLLINSNSNINFSQQQINKQNQELNNSKLSLNYNPPSIRSKYIDDTLQKDGSEIDANSNIQHNSRIITAEKLYNDKNNNNNFYQQYTGKSQFLTKNMNSIKESRFLDFINQKSGSGTKFNHISDWFIQEDLSLQEIMEIQQIQTLQEAQEFKIRIQRFRMKIKLLMKNVLQRCETYRLKNLTQFQYYLINDLSYFWNKDKDIQMSNNSRTIEALTYRYVVLCIMIIDTLLTLNLGFYQKGILIVDRKMILHNYYKNLFYFDICGFFSVLVNFFDQSRNIYAFIMEIPFFFKIFQLKYKIDFLEKLFVNSGSRSNLYNFFKLIFSIATG
ncbi:hypothetical protein PPERSA_08226 [Pseudocohnilembus persalinus]|uniref:Uncharacterized protein n=1 Tax=Pseudocohnilembus persalinus TaxID=266149 RepID=A0A0V0QGC4_PSEPJ|nr:hypothetical protein PPERSA_08226 [Pseudocohnilembus persalinus]|eukprot:KRX01125.1 hypothetical protein PPERSA_08226 [Pseudocohnilembus persalinus]